MKLNKLQLSLISSLVLFIIISFIYINSEIPLKISTEKPITICILNEKNPFILKYESAKRTVILSKLDKKIKLNGTNFQKAYTLLNSISLNNLSGKKIYFIDNLTDMEYDYIINYIPNWRKNILNPIKFIRQIIQIKEKSNFSYLDLLTLFIEISHLNSSNFFVEEIKIKAELEEKNEEVINNPEVKVEIINASNKKNIAFLTAKYLQAKKINVLNISNSKIQNKTKIICNSNEKLESAKKVREALKMKNMEIYIKSSKYRIFDVTLIIGEDFDFNNIKN